MTDNFEKEITASEIARHPSEDVACMTDEAIDVLSDSLKLRMPKAILYETLRCLRIEKTEPNEEILRSLDEIWYKISARPSNIAIYEVFAENGELIATLNDLYEKSEYIKQHNDSSASLTLCDVAKVASLYLSMIGVAASDDVGFVCIDKYNELAFTSDNETVASLFIDTSKPLPYGYAKNEKTSSGTQERDKIYSLAKNRTEENFIRRVSDRHIPVSVNVGAESFAPSNYEKLKVTMSDKTLECEQFHAFETDGYTFSTHLCKPCSFTDGINTALDTLFTLLAKGIDRRKIAFSLKYSVDTKNIAPSLAAMLGVYRVMIELCIPDKNALVVEAGEASVFCAAYSRDVQKEGLSDRFRENGDGNNVFMLSFPRRTDSSPALMPDFAALRSMCQRLYSLISDNAALSVRAFNGSLSKAVSDMCSEDYELDTSVCGEFDTIRAQGFIIETKPTKNIPFAKLVGTLKKKDFETQQNSQSSDGN